MAKRATALTRNRDTHSEAPAWIKPQLTELVKEAPAGPEWLHQIKFEGYRIMPGLTAAPCGC